MTKKDFKVVGFLRKDESRKIFPYALYFSKNRYYMREDFEKLVKSPSILKRGRKDWISIIDAGEGFSRIGRAFISSTGKGVTFNIHGMDYYGSLEYARNLTKDKADFVCISKKVLG